MDAYLPPYINLNKNIFSRPDQISLIHIERDKFVLNFQNTSPVEFLIVANVNNKRIISNLSLMKFLR